MDWDNQANDLSSWWSHDSRSHDLPKYYSLYLCILAQFMELWIELFSKYLQGYWGARLGCDQQTIYSGYDLRLQSASERRRSRTHHTRFLHRISIVIANGAIRCDDPDTWTFKNSWDQLRRFDYILYSKSLRLSKHQLTMTCILDPIIGMSRRLLKRFRFVQLNFGNFASNHSKDGSLILTILKKHLTMTCILINWDANAFQRIFTISHI